jgi:plasmid maintenance system antidote protein VapI
MAKKITQAQRIRDYFTKNPGKTVSEVAKAMGLKYQIVYMTKRAEDKKLSAEIAYRIGKGRNPKQQDWKVVHISTTDTSIEKAMEQEFPITMHEPEADPVNHPAHYKYGGIETIDFIEAKELNYNMGNAVKYITRADHKGNRKQDLEKAIWYLKRELGHNT